VPTSTCSTCNGTGRGIFCMRCCTTGTISCRYCGGSGNVRSGRGWPDQTETSCGPCYGSGEVRCDFCGGRGYSDCTSCNGSGYSYSYSSSGKPGVPAFSLEPTGPVPLITWTASLAALCFLIYSIDFMWRIATVTVDRREVILPHQSLVLRRGKVKRRVSLREMVTSRVGRVRPPTYDYG